MTGSRQVARKVRSQLRQASFSIASLWPPKIGTRLVSSGIERCLPPERSIRPRGKGRGQAVVLPSVSQSIAGDRPGTAPPGGSTSRVTPANDSARPLTGDEARC